MKKTFRFLSMAALLVVGAIMTGCSNEDNIDNQLVALFAYYSFLIIGIDLDSFAPMGGEDVLQRCMPPSR